MKPSSLILPGVILLLGCFTFWLRRSDSAMAFNCWRNDGTWDAAERLCRIDARTYGKRQD